MCTYREEQAPVWREGGALAAAKLGVGLAGVQRGDELLGLCREKEQRARLRDHAQRLSVGRRKQFAEPSLLEADKAGP